jgi:carboxypeptidase Taq
VAGLDQKMAAGEFQPLLCWLVERVHRTGRKYPTAELIRRITGNEPSPAALVHQLRLRYGNPYGV